MAVQPKSTLPIIAWDQAYNRNGVKNLPREVVNVIRTYVNNTTLEGWVTQDTLMADTGLSLRQVQRQIKQNEDAGWLKRVERGNSAGWANRYRLTTPDDVSVVSTHPVNDIFVVDPFAVDHSTTNTSSTNDMDVTPTTPRTSPKRSSYIETSRDDKYVVQCETATADGPAVSDCPVSAVTERSEGTTTPHSDDKYVVDAPKPAETIRRCRCGEPGAPIDPFCACKNEGSFVVAAALAWIDDEPPF